MKYEQFKKLGYTYDEFFDGTFSFRKKDDYLDKNVYFYPEFKAFRVDDCEWYDARNQSGWIPMEEREESVKHSARYGLWGEHTGYIDQKLHSAIIEVLNSLGW